MIMHFSELGECVKNQKSRKLPAGLCAESGEVWDSGNYARRAANFWTGRARQCFKQKEIRLGERRSLEQTEIGGVWNRRKSAEFGTDGNRRRFRKGKLRQPSRFGRQVMDNLFPGLGAHCFRLRLGLRTVAAFNAQLFVIFMIFAFDREGIILVIQIAVRV